MTKQYQQLIADYLAGDTSAADKLSQACQESPELRAQLSQDIAFERLLTYSMQQPITAEAFVANVAAELTAKTNVLTMPSANTSKTTVKQPAGNRGSNRFYYAVAASLLLFCLPLFWLTYSYSFKPVALVQNAVNAVSKQGQMSSGIELTRGHLSLQQGYAELKLSNDVVLVVEAPTELNIKSDQKIELLSGNLVAKVPQNAIGFQVDTPSSEIVDLGTEFGVSVDDEGSSQVHVINGEVKARANKQQDYVFLTENQARAFDLEQQVAVIKSQPHRFMRTLPGQSLQKPDYLHWSFDQLENDSFACTGSGMAGKCFTAHTAQIDEQSQGIGMAEGRFGKAVYFNGEDAWLETNFTGIGGNAPRTIAFWLKVPKDFSPLNGYGILSWGLSFKKSAWQVSPNPEKQDGPLGRIRIGTTEYQVIGSQDLRDDNWHHVAIVLFGGTDVNLATHVLLYIDGQLEKTSTKSIGVINTELNHPDSRPLNFGRNIAYWGGNTQLPYRFFRGWLDEVYIFNSALNQQQINNLKQNNRLD